MMLASIEERSAKIDTNQDDIKTVADARRLVDDFLARSRALQTLLATTIREGACILLTSQEFE